MSDRRGVLQGRNQPLGCPLTRFIEVAFQPAPAPRRAPFGQTVTSPARPDLGYGQKLVDPAQVGLLDVGLAQEIGGQSLRDDAALLEDVGPRGQGERPRDVLLHQEDADPRAVDVGDHLEELDRKSVV